MAELTMDELLKQLGELSSLKANRDELRKHLEHERSINRALQQFTASWNTLIVMGAIEWVSQNGTAFQIEVGGVEYLIRADVKTYCEGDMMLVRGHIVQVGGGGDIVNRVYVDPYDVQFISRPTPTDEA